ncbi:MULTISPECIES: GNAT family N-acetyltransferase [Bacillus]|uniref:GNAT family N-acetyltransferase n=1 Tax=Bacillus TaxID=1386 RepID=UPI000F7B811E|nr:MULTISPECIES: GNAT family N-acetyltransferase [Bacillus]MCA1013366.1 GNAT family N-acetyltransferase [Bacillus stratosphericus]MCA2384031.1 GNAT family N-acetyltransferase [Bacillus stratosphericus]MCA2398206.1 GNAT family N-acetyltransferase [Bacillus stratosphericus]MDJ0285342.1 GNAT family N-acetyltransferase [Bacillus altitudinis]
MFIREASIEDYPQLRQIYLESRRQSFHWLNTEEIKLQDFDQDTQEEQIFLAEESNKILGFISLYVPDRFIHLLFVHPEAVGQGAGDLLLKHAIKVLGTPVTLKCVSENHIALSFYQKRGWKAVVEEGEPGAKYWVLAYE